MDPLIFIGELGLDLIHLIAIVATLALAAVCYKLRELLGRAEAVREEVEADLAQSEEVLKTQRTRAETAELQLAELRGQTAKQNEAFGEIARGVMQQTQKHFIAMADETFKMHREGAKGELSELMKPIGENFTELEPEDLLKFGLIPEFVGRLPVVSTLRPLKIAELIHVLTEPKNAMVKQYSKLLAMDGVDPDITEDGLEAMAEEAIERGTGARALRSIFEKLMHEVMYDAPSLDGFSQVTVDREVVEGTKEPKVVKQKKKPADDEAEAA